MYHNPILFLNPLSMCCYMWFFYWNECLIGPIFMTILNFSRHWSSVHPKSQCINLYDSFTHWHHSFGSCISNPIGLQTKKKITRSKNCLVSLDKGFCLLSSEMKLFSQLSSLYQVSWHTSIVQFIDTFSPSHIVAPQPGKNFISCKGRFGRGRKETVYRLFCLNDTENSDSLSWKGNNFLWLPCDKLYSYKLYPFVHVSPMWI